MTDTPTSSEYANEKLKAALIAADEAEIKKWDFIIKIQAYSRARRKHRARAFRQLSARA